MWLCSCCGQNNEDTDLSCLICGTPKPADTAADTVCTLTQKRATELCSYEDVTIPSEFNVIGENAFKGRTDLYTVNIHSGVKKIMKGAFEGCTNLCKVYYSGKLSSIGARAFANCKHLSPEKRPAADRVASDAFVGCSATPIPDPERVVGARKTSTSKTSSTGTSGGSPFTTEFKKGSSTLKGSTAGTKTSTSGTKTSTSSGVGSFTKKSGTTSAPRKSSPPPGYRPVSGTSTYTPPKPSPAPTRTSTYTPPYTPTKTATLFEKTRWIVLAVGILLSIAMFIFCEWGHRTFWTEWSYMLGLTAALLAVGYGFVFLCEGHWRENSWLGTVMLVLAALLNWWFGSDCLSITAILTVTGMTLAGINAFFAFDDAEGGDGWWNVAITVLDTALLIYAMIEHSYVSNWELWQILISIVLSVILATATKYILEDKYMYEFGTGIQLCGLIVTALMCWWFDGSTVMMVNLLSLAMAITGVISTVACFKDDESGFATYHILLTVGNVIVLAVNQTLFG